MEKYIRLEKKPNDKVEPLGQEEPEVAVEEDSIQTASQWWSSLDHNDRARIIVPFIQLVGWKEKPFKCHWEYLSDQELDKLWQMLKDNRKLRIQKVGPKS